MTRKDKIYYLTLKGEKIEWHSRTSDGRLVIDAIEIDGEWREFKSTSKDQVAAGQRIDLLYYNWTMGD